MTNAEGNLYAFPEELKSRPLLREIQDWSYLRRRRYAWATFEPRFERFTYRYSSLDSLDHAKDILIKSHLWLSAPADFNDPFDCKAHVINEENAAKRRLKLDQILRSNEPQLNGVQRKRRVTELMARPAEEWLKIYTRATLDETKFLGVTCFSDDPRNLLMWSHYAKNHTGVCYQFETLNDIDVFSRALPVKYTKAYPTLNAFSISSKSGEDSIRMLLTKFEDWQYEKERRIVAPQGARKSLPFQPSALSGVILGAQISKDSCTEIETLVDERLRFNLPPIRIFKAIQHASAYRLTIHRRKAAS